jgi:NAD(P)-dependent dehydrogenase (short-subunit alcohol dehydrogenase family)
MRVLITGAGGDLGVALVRGFAERGDEVIAMVRSQVAARQRASLSAQWVAADLSDPGGLDAALDQLQVEWETVDVLIHAAAYAEGVGPIWRLSNTDWSANLSVNILAAAALVRRIAPGMIERRDGQILCVVSAGAQTPLGFLAPYCVAKAGLAHYVRCLAHELGPFGVRANGVNVSFDGGVFRKHRALKQQAGYYKDRTASAVPARTAEECVATFLVACSQAGRDVNGAWLDWRFAAERIQLKDR